MIPSGCNIPRAGYSLGLLFKSYRKGTVTGAALWNGCENVIGGSVDYLGPPADSFYSASKELITGKTLSKITFNNGSIVFNNSPRQDIEGYGGYTPSKLDEVIVYDGQNKVIKKYELYHSYFDDASINTSPFQYYDQRLKLDSIGVWDSTGRISSYTLNYFSTHDLPSRYSKGQDFWGYYNGAPDNQSLLPDDIVLDSYIPDMHVPGGTRLSTNNADLLKKGILTSISYPTGGSTAFDYELNDYSNVPSTELYTMQSASLTAVSGAGGTDILTQTFHLNEMEVVYFSVTVTGTPDGSVYGYLLNGSTPIQNFYNGSAPSSLVLQAGDYSINVNAVTGHLVYLIASWNYKVFNLVNKQGVGLRIHRITNYDPNNVASVKRYAYTLDGTANTISSGRILSNPVWSYPSGIESGSDGGCTVGLTNFYNSVSTSVIPLGLTTSNTLGYDRVTEWIGENGEGGRTVFKLYE